MLKSVAGRTQGGRKMLTREATYEDYGFSEEEDKKFNEFCRKLEMRDKILLLQCAAEVYPKERC